MALTLLLPAAVKCILRSHSEACDELHCIDVFSIIENLRESILNAVETVSAKYARKDLPQALIVKLQRLSQGDGLFFR